jgi:hypothetical protein
VESSRDQPWILIHEYYEQGKHDERAYPGDRLIFTSEANVARVVVGYIKKGDEPRREIGFRIREAEEDEPPDEG